MRKLGIGLVICMVGTDLWAGHHASLSNPFGFSMSTQDIEANSAQLQASSECNTKGYSQAVCGLVRDFASDNNYQILTGTSYQYSSVEAACYLGCYSGSSRDVGAESGMYSGTTVVGGCGSSTCAGLSTADVLGMAGALCTFNRNTYQGDCHTQSAYLKRLTQNATNICIDEFGSEQSSNCAAAALAFVQASSVESGMNACATATGNCSICQNICNRGQSYSSLYTPSACLSSCKAQPCSNQCGGN